MPTAVLLLVLGFQIKHFIADYLLQFDWMVSEKGDVRKFGGYAHAGMHVIGSAIILLLASVPLPTALMLLIAEFLIHYVLDFAKVYYSRHVTLERSPQRYFALHGLDQFLHHLTYLAMTYYIVLATAVS